MARTPCRPNPGSGFLPAPSSLWRWRRHPAPDVCLATHPPTRRLDTHENPLTRALLGRPFGAFGEGGSASRGGCKPADAQFAWLTLESAPQKLCLPNSIRGNPSSLA